MASDAQNSLSPFHVLVSLVLVCVTDYGRGIIKNVNWVFNNLFWGFFSM